MNFTHYLPETEKRIKRLRQIINGRPVAIMVQGYSITELEERIEELADLDICYASLNAAWLLEDCILRQIGKQFSIYECCSIPGLEAEVNNALTFLGRSSPNMFISTYRAFKQQSYLQWMLEHYFLKEYNDRLFFFDSWFYDDFNKVPSEDKPLHFPPLNTLSSLIYLSIIGKAPLIVIFGADGGQIGNNDSYYRQSEMATYRQPSDERRFPIDVKDFNTHLIPTINRVCQLYNIWQPPIYNCSPQSRLTVLRRINYDDAFRILKEKR